MNFVRLKFFFYLTSPGTFKPKHLKPRLENSKFEFKFSVLYADKN